MKGCTVHITYAMVRDEMPRIIETRGENFIYDPPKGTNSTCQYVWEGKPDCLIGCFLVDLGVPLEAFESDQVKEISDLVLDGTLERYGCNVEPEAMHAMAKIQWLQDLGYPWGYAYNNAFEPDIDE